MNAGDAEPKTLKAPNLASAAHLSPDWEIGYNRLLLKSEGVLYEDGQIQVGLRSEYRGQMACIILYFSNKSPTAISSFTTTLDLDPSEKSKLTYDVKGLPESTIAEGAQSQQMVMFEAKSVFTKSPTIRISYLAGALQALTLAIPLTIHKFMDPAELSSEDFFKRWKQIGGAPREAQRVFGVKGGRDSEREINPEFVRRTVEGFKWGILDGVDPNKKNFVGASVLHTSEGGKFGCLLRLEPNYETQVCNSLLKMNEFKLTSTPKMFRLTIRATDESVPAVILKLMEERLAVGVSVRSERAEPPTRRDISDAFANVMVS
jgi:AP-2 complex subunit alpha